MILDVSTISKTIYVCMYVCMYLYMFMVAVCTFGDTHMDPSKSRKSQLLLKHYEFSQLLRPLVFSVVSR